MWNKETHCYLGFLMRNGNLLGKSNQAEIRSANKRIRGYEFHTTLEQFIDDTFNLDQV